MPESLSPLVCFLAAGLAVVLCCGHAHGAIVVPDGAPLPVVWPLPQSATFGAGGSMAVSTSFVVTAAGSSQRLTAAAARYTTIIQAQVKNAPVDVESLQLDTTITSLSVSAKSYDEALNAGTSYNYSLHVSPSGEAQVTADTPYGAMYGMETFSELVQNGTFNWGSASITDWPHFKHRGFMIDTGRRFFPVDVVQSVLDGMSYNKLNVLHFHASDFCRFAIESTKFPQLTANLTGPLMGGFYTQAEVRSLVQYAGDRGIRVMPEFDLPGHAKGMDPLRAVGMQFCSASPAKQLYNDPEGRTVGILKELLSEMSMLFVDELFHIGCDETGVVGKCTIDNIASTEKEMQAHLHTLNRTPVGWEEILFDSHAAEKGTVVNAWARHTSGEVTDLGYQSVESASSHFYLNNKPSVAALWTDIAPQFTPAQDALMLGGEVSMWSDNYCYIEECGAFGTTNKPVGYQLFGPGEDKAFATSVSGLMWPKAAIAAGAFFNYDASLETSSAEFLDLYTNVNLRLLARGIQSCPPGCVCEETTRCGKPLVPPDCAAAPYDNQNVANYECASTKFETWSWSDDSAAGPIVLTSDKTLCLNVQSPAQPKGSNVNIATCSSGSTAQQFEYDATTKHIRWMGASSGEYCLDITGHSSASGANVEIWTCNQPISSNQQWGYNAGTGEVTSMMNDFCLGTCK